MAKKQTTQDQDSIREERAYNRERTRIESYENSSKNRARRRVLDGIGKIVTGRRREGVREIREAARQRTEESVRNRVMGAIGMGIRAAFHHAGFLDIERYDDRLNHEHSVLQIFGKTNRGI